MTERDAEPNGVEHLPSSDRELDPANNCAVEEMKTPNDSTMSGRVDTPDAVLSSADASSNEVTAEPQKVQAEADVVNADAQPEGMVAQGDCSMSDKSSATHTGKLAASDSGNRTTNVDDGLKQDSAEETTDTKPRKGSTEDGSEDKGAPPVSVPLTEQIEKLLNRIESLEAKVEELDGDSDDESDDAQDKPTKEVNRLIPTSTINRLSFDEYKKRKFAFDKPHCSIDVVMTDVPPKTVPNPKTVPDALNSSGDPTAVRTSQLLDGPEPFRFIQINSPALHAALDDPSDRCIVMLAPFKPLVYCEEQYRARLRELATKWSAHETGDKSAPAPAQDEPMISNPKGKAEGRRADDAPVQPGLSAAQTSNSVDDASASATESSAAGQGSKDVLPPVNTASEEEQPMPVNDGQAQRLTDVQASDAASQAIAASGITPSTLPTKEAPDKYGEVPSSGTGNDVRVGSQQTGSMATPEPKTEPEHDQSADTKDGETAKVDAGDNGKDVVAGPRPNLLTSEDKSGDSRKAYEDLRCLMEFYDEEVKPHWDFLRGRRVKQVRFGDLWALFQPGDEVVMPGSSQKVWRVVKVTGGRPFIDHLLSDDYGRGDTTEFISSGSADREKPSAEDGDAAQKKAKSGKSKSTSDRANWSSFALDGYYIDFNGKEFGAVHTRCTIKYFAGLRDVKQLTTWPLRLADETGAKRSDLILNGRRFLSLTHNGLRYYEGRTLTEGPRGSSLDKEVKAYTDAGFTASLIRQTRAEDVSSQVFVDFERTFQYNPSWAPKFGMEDFASENEREADASCAPDTVPLNFEVIYQWIDYYDRRQTSAYRARDEWVQVAGEKSTDDRDRFVEDEYALLLPDRVFGFVLRSRTWACFDMRPGFLRDITPDESGWTELQLPKGHKRTLESLVERHFRNKEAVARQVHKGLDFDFVRGKGKGLIVLLHGAPGVGKTSTVETVAEKYLKPLLPITCGNLGLDSVSVEQALTDNFALAQAWDCIVLLDEADVFLAARGKTDLQRNALVSVFLRTLEYYTGILFLTTNRTGAFDEAFRSRIHTALYYPDLQREATEAIWRTNLDRVLQHFDKRNDQKLIVETGGEDIMRFAMVHYDAMPTVGRSVWNGRQIRNAFQTAVALAEFDAREKNIAPILDWTHFRTVALAADEFETYLRDTRGWSEAYMAGDENLRAFYTEEHNLPPGFDEASAHRASLQEVSMTDSQRIIGGLNPNVIIAPQTSFARETAFFASNTGPQRRPTLNQRIPSQYHTAQKAPMSNPTQMARAYDQTMQQQFHPPQAFARVPGTAQGHQSPNPLSYPHSVAPATSETLPPMQTTGYTNPPSSGQFFNTQQAYHQQGQDYRTVIHATTQQQGQYPSVFAAQQQQPQLSPSKVHFTAAPASVGYPQEQAPPLRMAFTNSANSEGQAVAGAQFV